MDNGRVTDPIHEISDGEKEKIHTILVEKGVIAAQ